MLWQDALGVKIEPAAEPPPGTAARAVNGEYGIVAAAASRLIPDRVEVIARGTVFVVAAEDVTENERATALPDGSVGGRGDAAVGTAYPDRARLDAWWGPPARRGEVGKLKVGEPWNEDELARARA